MDECLQEALKIVKAQASVRAMTVEETATMATALADSIRTFAESKKQTRPDPVVVKNSIRNAGITCLECGQNFKLLTSRHLAIHGLTADEYREKYGLPPGTPLACKALRRKRQESMTDRKNWEKRILKKHNGKAVVRNAEFWNGYRP